MIKMALPLVATSFIQTAYSLVDMIWIGRLGSGPVAAVGTASFYINLAFALSTLILTGSGIKFSHMLGAGDTKGMNQYVNNAFMAMVGLGLAFTLSILALRHDLIAFFGIQDPVIQDQGVAYLSISMVGVVIMYLNMLYTSLFNCHGNSKITFKVNSLGLVINMILDPLMIFGLAGLPQMGVEGAALASLLGRLSVFIFYVHQAKKQDNMSLTRRTIDWSRLLEVLKLGAPYSLQRVAFIGISMVMARLIASFGAGGIAVQKIGLQVESISYMTIGGLYGAVSVFVGQNYGKGNMKRIGRGYKVALTMSGAFGLVTSLIFIGFAEDIFRIFVKDQATIQLGVSYLTIIGLSQLFMCLEIVTMASFNGMGKTYVPASVSLIFTGLRIPMAWLLASQEGLKGVWWTISTTSMIKGSLLVTLFIVFISKKKKKEGVHA